MLWSFIYPLSICLLRAHGNSWAFSSVNSELEIWTLSKQIFQDCEGFLFSFWLLGQNGQAFIVGLAWVFVRGGKKMAKWQCLKVGTTA